MKKAYFYLLGLVFCCACDSYLDVVPDNIATLDYAFRDRAGAEMYLATCYSLMPAIGDPRSDPGLMGADDTWSPSVRDQWINASASDFHCYNIKINQNTNSPHVNCWEGQNQGRGLFAAIRVCNIFLENIDKVGPDLKEEEKIRWIAEVKFLKAYYHYYLLKAYGPIPLVKENMPIDAGVEEVKVYRDRFDDCVDYIVQLINEAVPDLPLVIFDMTSELRRITQPIALSVKAELLVTAASDLFSHNPDYENITDNRGVYIFRSTTTKQERWERAMIACKNAIDTVELTGQIGLYDFSQSPFYSSYATGISDTSKLVMTLRTVVTDKWNREIIWGTRLDQYQSITMPMAFTTAQVTASSTNPVIAPTMAMAELFYSNNGVPIDEDKYYDYDHRLQTDTAASDHRYYMVADGVHPIAKINMNREPRFYANLGFDGGYWLGNGRKLDFDRTPADQVAWVTEMLRGKPSGNYDALRYSVTGYLLKKGSHIESAYNTAGTSFTTTQATFPIMRLADLYLLYAEALNECVPEPTPEVYHYVDVIRERAGLQGVELSWRQFSEYPDRPLSQEGMRRIIRQERLIELAFEGKRFWDLRRWMTAEVEMNKPVRGWNVMGEVPEDYYNVVTISSLTFNKRDYLWPIRQGEILKNPNLKQNPGW
jgi:hypothetical protein